MVDAVPGVQTEEEEDRVHRPSVGFPPVGRRFES